MAIPIKPFMLPHVCSLVGRQQLKDFNVTIKVFPFPRVTGKEVAHAIVCATLVWFKIPFLAQRN
jgi:hypothetical protein